MIGLPENVSELLDTGFARLFAVDDERDRIRGVHELLASCGFSSVSELQAAVHDQEHSERMFKVDRDILAPVTGESWLIFMNHGYAPTDHDASRFPSLDAEDDKWRHQVFLYFYLLNFAKARHSCMGSGECDLLDVGCGRGGGLAAMKRYYGLRRAVGIDANPQQIAFCIDRHQKAGLEFANGSAMALPVSSESIDVVTNVESSHCYDDLPRFLAEVRRVLRPNGLFLLADNRERCGGKRFTLEAALLGSGLRLVHKENITERVRQACIRDTERFKSIFSNEKAEGIRKVSENSEKAYASGSGIYLAYVLEKESRVTPCS